MARPSYTITRQDFSPARAYIERKFLNPYWPGEALRYEAETAFDEAKRTEAGLQQWCDDWLDAEQWQNLKDAIRAARRRKTYPAVVTITISRTSWLYLNALAKHHQEPLSATLERYLKPEWQKLD